MQETRLLQSAEVQSFLTDPLSVISAPMQPTPCESPFSPNTNQEGAWHQAEGKGLVEARGVHLCQSDEIVHLGRHHRIHEQDEDDDGMVTVDEEEEGDEVPRPKAAPQRSRASIASSSRNPFRLRA